MFLGQEWTGEFSPPWEPGPEPSGFILSPAGDKVRIHKNHQLIHVQGFMYKYCNPCPSSSFLQSESAGPKPFLPNTLHLRCDIKGIVSRDGVSTASKRYGSANRGTVCKMAGTVFHSVLANRAQMCTTDHGISSIPTIVHQQCPCLMLHLFSTHEKTFTQRIV
jgi:hypothetical protein